MPACQSARLLQAKDRHIRRSCQGKVDENDDLEDALKLFISIVLAATLVFAPASVSATETATYTFDELGRLTATSISGTVNNGVQVTTSYDPAGNRTNQTVTGAASGGSGGGSGALATIKGTFVSGSNGGASSVNITPAGVSITKFSWSNNPNAGPAGLGLTTVTLSVSVPSGSTLPSPAFNSLSNGQCPTVGAAGGSQTVSGNTYSWSWQFVSSCTAAGTWTFS